MRCFGIVSYWATDFYLAICSPPDQEIERTFHLPKCIPHSRMPWTGETRGFSAFQIWVTVPFGMS